MVDTVDPLNALQAIRLPVVPASSLGEQISAALLAGTVAALLIHLVLAYRNKKRAEPVEKSFIRAIEDTLILPEGERLTAQASVIRRYVDVVAGDIAARKQGEDWLEELDGLFQTEFFRKGAGRALHEGLYSRQRTFETAALGPRLCELLQGRMP
jgi:hypothetical protein